VLCREQHCGRAHSGALADQKASEARHEIVVQKKLLVARPQNLTGHMLEVAFIQRMQSTDLFRDEHACDGEDDGQDHEKRDR
jgi:hypothetical protein